MALTNCGKKEEEKTEKVLTSWNNLQLVEWEPSALTVVQLSSDRGCRVEVVNPKSEIVRQI